MHYCLLLFLLFRKWVQSWIVFIDFPTIKSTNCFIVSKRLKNFDLKLQRSVENRKNQRQVDQLTSLVLSHVYNRIEYNANTPEPDFHIMRLYYYVVLYRWLSIVYNHKSISIMLDMILSVCHSHEMRSWRMKKITTDLVMTNVPIWIAGPCELNKIHKQQILMLDRAHWVIQILTWPPTRNCM